MYLYWIKAVNHNNIAVEGYVGVSNDPLKRFSAHKTAKNKVGNAIRKYDISEPVIIFEGTEEECLAKENELRPSENIGWNTATGGGIPPTTFSNKRGEDKSSAAKRGWTEERKKRQSDFMKGNSITPRETSDALRKKRSENAKKRYSDPKEREKQSQLMMGKKRGKYNMTKEYPTIVCPHCGLSSNKHGAWGIMKRWHFDNCKLNPDLVPHIQCLPQ